MNAHKSFLSVLSLTLILVIVLSACNLPSKTKPPELTTAEKAATVVALTLTAQPSPTQTSTPAATPTLKITETATPTITPTYSKPMLKIEESTNCRTGPGQSYPVVFTFLAGANVEILGSYPDYWVVKNPDGANCWVWGQYATVSGSHWTVPTMTAPPTATSSPPIAPSNLRYQFTCSYNGSNNDASVTLTWNDNTNDELGFRVFRYGNQIAELPPNTTTYSDVYAVNSGTTITYSVESYNSVGTSGRPQISFSCP
jgi:hypothetical protein